MWPYAAHTNDKTCLIGTEHINQDEMRGSQAWHWEMQALKDKDSTWFSKHHQEGNNVFTAIRNNANFVKARLWA